jgi:hypothetical protein
MTLVLVKKDNNSKTDLFSLILTNELLKHCNDYNTLKTIQMSASSLNYLFTCPSQTVWKRLCHRYKYNFLLKKEARCLWKRSVLIWESIYYQNWKVDFNWDNKKYEISDLNKIFKDSLMKMVNTTLSISIPIESDGFISIWDVKRVKILYSHKVSGLITSSCLQGNLLILGKSCGSITVLKVLCSLQEEKTIKYHSKGISYIIVDIKNNCIISADIGGQIIKSSLNDAVPIVLYHNSSGSGITGLILRNNSILATSIDASLIEISLQNYKTKKIGFDNFGSINCISSNNSHILMGNDSGQLLLLYKGKIKIIETADSPIISISANSKRVSVGHFNGTISVLIIDGDSLRPLFTETKVCKGAVWSLAMDEINLISCSLQGELILRTFL